MVLYKRIFISGVSSVLPNDDLNKIILKCQELGQDYIEKIEEDILVLDNYFNT